jgi:hypothetical protein
MKKKTKQKKQSKSVRNTDLERSSERKIGRIIEGARIDTEGWNGWHLDELKEVTDEGKVAKSNVTEKKKK